MLPIHLVWQEEKEKQIVRVAGQPKKNNLSHMIDPTIRNINSLFALLFELVEGYLQETLSVGNT